MSKDFNKYAYFVSKAKNFAIAIRPDKKKIVDGEVVFEPGLRVEFHNGMLEVEKNDNNKIIIETLRKKLDDQKDIDPKRRSFWEEQAPKEMVEVNKVKDLLGEKNDKIAELEKELAELKKKK